MKWPDEQCPNCRNSLPRNSVYCPPCRLASPTRMKQDSEARARAKSLRAQRQQQEFLHAFDKRAFELVITKLKAVDKVTVSDLIPLLAEEGFFKLYRYNPTTQKMEQSPITDLEQIKRLKFDHWARKRVLGLAKWWARLEPKLCKDIPTCFIWGRNRMRSLILLCRRNPLLNAVSTKWLVL